jgi:hypothetical protein
MLMFDVASSPSSILRDAYLDYRFADEFHIRAGQQKRLMDFEGFTYGPRTVLVEASPTVFFFDALPGREFEPGVTIWGQAIDKKLEYRFGLFNGDGPNNGASLTNLGPGGQSLTPLNSNNNDSSGVEASGRVMFSPTGGFEPDTLGYVEGDYGISEDPKVGFGVSGDFNPERVSLVGTPPVPTKLISDTYTWSADAEFKYQGIFAIAEGFYQTVVNRTSGTSNLGNSGFFGQVGYFFGSDVKNRGFEVIGRYSNIDVDSPVPVAGGPPASAITGTHDYTLGLNYVFAGHRLKLQSAYTYREAVVRALNNYYDNIFQLQVQLVF